MNSCWLWLQLSASTAAIISQVVLSGLIYKFTLVIVSKQLGEFIWTMSCCPWRMIIVQLAVMQKGSAATIYFVNSLFSCNLCRSDQVVLDTFDCGYL